jgi:hypothetical protein
MIEKEIALFKRIIHGKPRFFTINPRKRIEIVTWETYIKKVVINCSEKWDLWK